MVSLLNFIMSFYNYSETFHQKREKFNRNEWWQNLATLLWIYYVVIEMLHLEL